MKAFMFIWALILGAANITFAGDMPNQGDQGQGDKGQQEEAPPIDKGEYDKGVKDGADQGQDKGEQNQGKGKK